MKHYPENEKIDKTANGFLQEFVDFLKENKYLLRKETLGYEKHISFQNIIYEYFGVDPKKIEKERRAMLEDLK